MLAIKSQWIVKKKNKVDQGLTSLVKCVYYFNGNTKKPNH